MLLSDFDYQLPSALIAQAPATKRDHSRLMVVNRKTGDISHDHFYNLRKYLLPTDLLVFNETKVFPARLLGHKTTGGRVEVLLLNIATGEFISRPGLKDGQQVIFESGLSAIVQVDRLIFNTDYTRLKAIVDIIGHTPLPPYIDPSLNPESPNIRQRYQTVYAKYEGSVAAPTAGFHFTKEIMNTIPLKAFITLHVGLGTFKPVKTENIEDHHMHPEWYSIPDTEVHRFKKAKRIVAVGTTSVRTLESWAKTGKTEGETNIFIYPGYKFKIIDAMITNFHLPKSTLLILVSAFAGQDLIKRAYQQAIAEKYRFYSFGDAMLIV